MHYGNNKDSEESSAHIYVLSLSKSELRDDQFLTAHSTHNFAFKGANGTI